MTDTGQVPDEGLPENAGGQPGLPPHSAYTYLDPQHAQAAHPGQHADGAHDTGGYDDDLLLMPGAQGAWSEHQPQYQQPAESVPVPVPGMPDGSAAPGAYPSVAAHDTAYDTAYDTGVAGYPDPSIPQAAAPQQGPVTAAAGPARRPLHMGPPVPDPPTGSVVRSLADRGPAAAPPAMTQSAPFPQQGPPSGEVVYLDAPPEQSAEPLPGPRPGELPPQGEPWTDQPQQAVAPQGQAPGLDPQPADPAQSEPAAPVVGTDAAATAAEHAATGEGLPVAEEQPLPGEVPAAPVPAGDLPPDTAAAAPQEGMEWGAPDQTPVGVGASVVPGQQPHAGASLPGPAAADGPYVPPQAAQPGPPGEPHGVAVAFVPAQATDEPTLPTAGPVPGPQAPEPADAEPSAQPLPVPSQADAPQATQPAVTGQGMPEQPGALPAELPAETPVGQPSAEGTGAVPDAAPATPEGAESVPAAGGEPTAESPSPADGPAEPGSAVQPVVTVQPGVTAQADDSAAGGDAAQTEAAVQPDTAAQADGQVRQPDAAAQADTPTRPDATAPSQAPAQIPGQVPAQADAAQPVAPAQPDAAAAQVDTDTPAAVNAEQADVQAAPAPVRSDDSIHTAADPSPRAEEAATAEGPQGAAPDAPAPVAPGAESPAAPVEETAEAGVPGDGTPGTPTGQQPLAEQQGPAEEQPAVAQQVLVAEQPADAATTPDAAAEQAQEQTGAVAPESAEVADPAAGPEPEAGAEPEAVPEPQAVPETEAVVPATVVPEAVVPAAVEPVAAPAGAESGEGAAAPRPADADAPGPAPQPEPEPVVEAAPAAEQPVPAQAHGPETAETAETAEAAEAAEAAGQAAPADAAGTPADAGPAAQPAPAEAAAQEPQAQPGPEARATEQATETEQATPAQQSPEATQDTEISAPDHQEEAAQDSETAADTDVAQEVEGAQPQPTQARPAPESADAAAAPQDLPAQPAAPVGPPAEGYGEAERAAVHRVMRERRDIRNGFRADPIPHEVLLRVLEAAHTAPSVGHSQPWDFVVIRSEETRRAMHELANRQREAYAKSLPKARAKQFKQLKIEAILDTPVNIVVTADPTRGGRHTLGRHTQPQMAPYSSALAVENLWLAARAEGLGVGWVSFFDEREMVRELGLPEHLEVVAYLCVGYVDEFPDEPELMQAGWSKRRPLSWVVHEETYGRRALPGEQPHDLLQETLRGIRPLDAKALGEAWERQKRMTKPSGALGMLEIISAQLSGLSRKCPPPIPEPAAVAIFAGDHGVHAQGVTAWPQEVTSQMVANFLGGGAVCNAFANQVGAEVCVIDVGVAGELPSTPGLLPRKVRPGTDDFTVGPAMSREDALRAIEVGIETARDLVAAGNKALLTGEMGIANTTVSAALISVFTGTDPAEVTGRGTGINDEMHARKVDVVRRALELHQPDPADPIGVLAAVGGLEHAAIVGLLLGGASLRTPVILDGVSAGAAALVARAIAPEALAACIAGHRSAEPGHRAALTKLGLRPLIDLDLRLGEGTGALLALPVVQSAARAMHEVATFDSAGVTEKG